MAAESLLTEKLEAAQQTIKTLNAEVQKLQNANQAAEEKIYDLTEELLEAMAISSIRKVKLEEMKREKNIDDLKTKMLANSVKAHKRKGARFMAEKMRLEVQIEELERKLKTMAEERQTEE